MAQQLWVIRFEARGGPHDAGGFEVGDHRVVVGSDADCDFVLDEPEVAGEHASFRKVDSRVEVHVSGRRVARS